MMSRIAVPEILITSLQVNLVEIYYSNIIYIYLTVLSAFDSLKTYQSTFGNFRKLQCDIDPTQRVVLLFRIVLLSGKIST